MRTMCWSIAVVALVLGTGTSTAQAQQARDTSAQAKPAGAARPSLQRASCVLAIRGGVNSRELDIQTVSAAVTSTGVVDPAAKDVLGLEPTAWPEVVSIELTPAGPQAVKLTVTVQPRGDVKLPPDPARKLMDNVVNRVTKALKTDHPGRAAAEERQKKLETQQADLQRAVIAARADMEKVSESLRTAVDRTGPEPATVWKEDLQDKKVRVQALEAAFAEAKQARQPQLDAAKELLAARQTLVTKLEVVAATAKGQAADVDLARARADAAEAATQVAELSLNPAMDTKGRWFDMLVQMRMEIASLERRVASVKETAGPTTRPSRGELLAEQDRLNRKLNQLQNEMQLVSNQLEQARREANPFPGQGEARLVVLGAGSEE